MNAKLIPSLLVIGLMTVVCSGCATIFGHSTYPLMVSSRPDGASLTITDRDGVAVYRGTTPATLRLDASAGFFQKASYQILLTYPGYEDRLLTITARLNGWYFGNLLCGGILGMLIIDPLTGAMWTLDESFINETLTPLSSAATTQPELQIKEINNIPEEWKEHLVSIQ